jgi:MFS family permease
MGIAVTSEDATAAAALEGPQAPPAKISFRRAVIAFGFLMIAEFFYGWAWNTVDVLRPYLRDSLGLSLTQAGSGYSAQGAGALIGAIIIGQLADRFGRRNMLVVVMIGYGLSLLAGVAVGSYPQFLGQRFVLGLFMGGIFPIVVGIYVGLFESNVRGRLASLINAVFSLSIVSLGVASGALAHHDWRILLWVGGVPPVLLSVVAYLVIPPTADRIKGEAAPRKVPVMELFAPGLRLRTVSLALLTGLNFFAYQAYSGWLTIYLTDIRHLSAHAIGGLVAWQFTGNILGGFLWGWAGDRFGRRFNALGLISASVAIIVYLNAPTNLTTLSIIGFIYGLMLSSSVIWGPWITELYPPHLKSTAASIFNWGRIVSFFAPLLTGAFAGRFGLAATMGVASATFALAGLVWLSLPETQERALLTGRRVKS